LFFPIRDDVPTEHKPVLTVGLIAVNAAVFLFSQTLGARGFQFFTIQYGYIPYELIASVELTPELSASTWFTPFSSMFMHGGWMHILGNMLFLWIYGNNVEDFMGRVRFLLFYLAAGLFAIAAYTLFDPHSQIPLVGASGAIAGVMGSYMVLYPRAKVTVLIVFFFIQFVQLPAKVVLGIWFVFQLFMSLTGSTSGGGVAWMAHVGGFAFGWLVTRLVVQIKYGGPPPQKPSTYRVTWR
jgi:membrane associated rhomboid family serine protease